MAWVFDQVCSVQRFFVKQHHTVTAQFEWHRVAYPMFRHENKHVAFLSSITRGHSLFAQPQV
jgi:hypothetical protein